MPPSVNGFQEASRRAQKAEKGPEGPLFIDGGEGGIRTLDTLLTYTPLAGERLQPLGHFSKIFSSRLPPRPPHSRSY